MRPHACVGSTFLDEPSPEPQGQNSVVGVKCRLSTGLRALIRTMWSGEAWASWFSALVSLTVFSLDKHRHVSAAPLHTTLPIFKHKLYQMIHFQPAARKISWNYCHNPRCVSSCMSCNLYSSWVLNVSVYKKGWMVFQKPQRH